MENRIESSVKQLRKGSNTQVYNALVSLRTTQLRDRKEESLAEFREFGGPQSLIYLIQRPHHKIVDLALSILGNCCLERETRKIVGRLQGVQHIVKILECLEKESLLNRACRTLANLALDEQIAEEIMKSQAVHFIVQLLDSNTTTDTNLKQSAVRTLRILSSNAKHREEIVSGGAVRSIAKILRSEEDEALIECVLRTIVVMSSECSIGCAEQLQSSDCLEKLVSFSASENRTFQDVAVHVLANASKQASLRPLLGNAGALTSLVSLIEKWEKTSNGWQWAVDAFCQCTRESVNRLKVREGGGLKHLVSLLEEPVEERLWLCSLSSVINFLYDDASFSLLVDLGMVSALVDKLTSLAAREKPTEHSVSNIARVVPVDIGVSTEQCSKPLFDDQSSINQLRRPSQSSSHACCYSPDSSPPYWTSFPSCSSPTSQFQRMSPCSFSPFRDTSPLTLQPDEELCYSPVYESGDSEDEEGTKDSGNLEITDSSVATPSPSSVASDRPESSNARCSSESVGVRSPIGDILLLLSRLSLEENPKPCFVNLGTLTALVDYVVGVESPQLRAKRILSRVARNSLSFERLVVLRIPELFRQKLVLTPHKTDGECSACETIAVYGHSLMSDLRFQAESPFGSGVLHHLILTGRNQEEKLSALLATVFLVRSSKVQQQLLLDTDGLTFLTGVLSDVDHADYDAIVGGVVHLAQTVLSADMDPICDDMSEQVKSSDVPCIYVDSVKRGGDGDLVQLTVSNRNDHILAHRSVLARGCDVFNAMLCGSFAESQLDTVSLQDTSFEALEYVVHCLYSCHSGSCPILRIDCPKATARLLQAIALADKLLLPHVKDAIASRLISNPMQFTDAESVDTFVFSKIYDCPRLSSWIVRDTLTAKRFLDDNTRIHRIRELSMNCKQFTVDTWQLIAYGISTIT